MKSRARVGTKWSAKIVSQHPGELHDFDLAPFGAGRSGLAEADDLDGSIDHLRESDSRESGGRDVDVVHASASSQFLHAASSYGVVLGLSIVTNILAARALEPSQRGMLAAGIQAAFFLSSLLLLGVDKSTPIVFNESPMRRTIPFLWAASARQAFVLLFAGSVLTTIGLLGDFGAIDIILVFAFPTAIMAVATMLDASFRAVALNAHRSQLVLFSTTAVGTIILVGVAILAATSVTTMVVWLLLYGLARAGVSIGLHLRNGKPTLSVAHEQQQSLALLRSTGWKLWPASFANFAALRSDRLLLPLLASTGDLGVYVVISTLTDVLATPTEALANVMTPRWRTAALEGRLRTGPVFILTFGYLTATVALLTLFGPWITELLFGAAYRPATNLILTLAAASSIFGANRLLSGRAMALGATKSVSAAEASGMATAVVGYLVLIPTLGMIGAALGSLIGYTVTALGLILATIKINGGSVSGAEDPLGSADTSDTEPSL